MKLNIYLFFILIIFLSNFIICQDIIELSNESKKVLSFSLLKYKPKRLINFKKINIPLPSLGKVTFDYSRTFVSENESEIKSKKRNLYDFSKTPLQIV